MNIAFFLTANFTTVSGRIDRGGGNAKSLKLFSKLCSRDMTFESNKCCILSYSQCLIWATNSLCISLNITFASVVAGHIYQFLLYKLEILSV